MPATPVPCRSQRVRLDELAGWPLVALTWRRAAPEGVVGLPGGPRDTCRHGLPRDAVNGTEFVGDGVRRHAPEHGRGLRDGRALRVARREVHVTRQGDRVG